MARIFNKYFLLCILLLQLSLLTVAIDDDALPGQVAFTNPLQPYECAYPCLPPPVAPTIICSSPPPPPTPSASSPPPPLPPVSNYYPPPQSGWFSPPLAGDLPSYVPPEHPTYYGAPPPPNPIMPYFPFYYKNPPPADFSAAAKLDPRIACCIFVVAQALGLYIVK